MERLLISRCLLGDAVRYDGAGRAVPALLQHWQAEGRLVPLCPELAGGLGVPRLPAEIEGGQGGQVLDGLQVVRDVQGADVSAAFLHGAEQALQLCLGQGLRLALLKARSPSCGNLQNYDGQFRGRLVSGQGVTAALLARHGIEVFNEEQLPALQARLHALESVG